MPDRQFALDCPALRRAALTSHSENLMKKFLIFALSIVVVHAMAPSKPAAAQAADSGEYIQEEGHFATPTVDPNFGARAPRACPLITLVPSAAQAAVLVQCTMDVEMRSLAILHQDVTVSMGDVRDPTTTDQYRHIDTRYKVYEITASANQYQCGVTNDTGRNCAVRQFQNSPGVCWKTFDNGGAFRCQITGVAIGLTANQPPPTTF
jgi:hypothetical protein